MSLARPSSDRDPHSILELPADKYTVGWICAIPVELRTARCFFDLEHGQLRSRPKHDENSYNLGRICGHNVVMICLPELGGVKAAVAAKSLQATFPNVRFWLMVGIGGGIPNPPEVDIRLGDIVVSIPTDEGSGVIQYDLGRMEAEEFCRKGALSKPPSLLLAAVRNLQSRSGVGNDISKILSEVDPVEDLEGDTQAQTYPTYLVDDLFRANYTHVKTDPACDCENGTNKANTIARRKRNHQNPRIHYGNIASGNTVVKNAAERDRLAKRDNVICFEMEAFGLMDDFPCLVIRGISDYSDSHKNYAWQSYASSVAAAYTKKLLNIVPPEEVAKLKPVRNNVHWISLHPVSPFFTGRKQILQTLKDKFCGNDENARELEHRRFVIYGMGGAGKSEVCLRFAHENRESFWGVFWVDASSTESIRRGFIDIVKTATAKSDVTFENAKAWIENQAEKWLLIFDNADDPNIDYFKFLPSGEGGCILMTTRNDGCKIYGSGSTGYEKFEKLEFPDAVELLLKTANVEKVPYNLEVAQALVGDELLAQHTLSIVHAGAFIMQGLCRLDEYASMFGSQRARLLSQHPDQANSVYGDVYATFEVSAKAIEASHGLEAKDALGLLQVLAYFHREAVSEDMFTRAWEKCLYYEQGHSDEPDDSIRKLSSWHTVRLRQFLRPSPSTKELDLLSLRKARKVLSSFSLINVHPDTYNISMHPLVHTWAKDRLEVEMQNETWSTAAATLALSIDSLRYQDYFNSIQPHVESNISLRPKDYLLTRKWKTLEICRMFYSFAWMLYHQRNDTGALSLLHLISSLQCPEIPPNSLNWRHILFIYAACHNHLGNFSEELRLMEDVVSFDYNTLEPDNIDRLNAQKDLGVALIEQRKYQEAIEILEGVVKIQQDILHPEDQDLLPSKHELARAYMKNEQPEQAIQLLEEVVQIKERTLAPTHPERLVSQHELARAYISNEQLEKAIQLLEEVVQNKERTLAPTHPERLVSQHELARAYYRFGQYQRARPILQGVVRIKEETLEANHPDRIMSEGVLAVVVSAIERPEEAAEKRKWRQERRAKLNERARRGESEERSDWEEENTDGLLESSQSGDDSTVGEAFKGLEVSGGKRSTAMRIRRRWDSLKHLGSRRRAKTGAM